jgi:hypothetical protein
MKRILLSACFIVSATCAVASPARAEFSFSQISEPGFGKADNETAVLFARDGVLYALTDEAGNVPTQEMTALQYDGSGTGWSEVTDWPFLADDNTYHPTVSIHRPTHTKYFTFRNVETGAEVWQLTSDGTWTQLNEDGFGNANLVEVLDLVFYKGPLTGGEFGVVAFVQNNSTGKIQVRVHVVGDDPDAWTKLSAFDSQAYGRFKAADSLYNDTAQTRELYMAARHPETFDGQKRGQIWRSADGVNWDVVHTAEYGTFTQLVRGHQNERLFALGGRTKNRNCGDDRGLLSRKVEWTPWEIRDEQPQRHQCLQEMRFRSNGNALVSGWDEDAGLLWYRRRGGGEWNLVTDDGFGNPNNRTIEHMTVWDGHFVALFFNHVDGATVYRMSGLPEL